MADGATTELQDGVVTEVVEELVHLAGVDTAGRDRHDTGNRLPMLRHLALHVVARADEHLPATAALFLGHLVGSGYHGSTLVGEPSPS